MASKYSVAKKFIAVAVFLLSMLISPFYTGGDQEWYIKTYDDMAGLGLVDAFVLYKGYLGTAEFVHFFFIWLGSSLHIEKDLLMAIFNAIFAYLSMSFFETRKASVIVAMLIVLTNLYFMVLYFAAERLKFAFIFLAAALLFIDRPKRFYVTAILSVLAHIEAIVVFGSMFFVKISKRFLAGKIPKSTLTIIAISLIPLSLLASQIYTKFSIHSQHESRTVLDFARIFLFLALALLYSKDKRETLLLFIPLVVAIFLLDPNRLNMLGYFAFLYYALHYRGGWNAGVLLTSVYFVFATFKFVTNIFFFGNGFGDYLP